MKPPIPMHVTKILVHAAFMCKCGETFERMTTAPYEEDGRIGEPNPLPDDGRCNACEKKRRAKEDRDRQAKAQKRSAQRAFAKGHGVKLAT